MTWGVLIHLTKENTGEARVHFVREEKRNKTEDQVSPYLKKMLHYIFHLFLKNLAK